MQKRLGIINDISCEGRCSTTAALPIVSAAGIHPNLIPTAILSTQTGGYTDYTYMDLSRQMMGIARHFKALGLEFDGIYSGYLASEQQVDMVIEISQLLSPKLLVVDPVMGDLGKLYSGFTQSYCDKMKTLCAKADVIVPNVTEACFLTGRKYGPMTKEDILGLLKDLTSFALGRIVVTGINMEREMAVGIYEDGHAHIKTHQQFGGVYHGAGDVFGSAVTCGLLYGRSLVDAVNVACDFTLTAIHNTDVAGVDTRQGLCFESCLDIMIKEYVL